MGTVNQESPQTVAKAKANAARMRQRIAGLTALRETWENDSTGLFERERGYRHGLEKRLAKAKVYLSHSKVRMA